MIKVSEDTCESFAGQFSLIPERRTNEIMARIIDENPEFINGVQQLFAMHMQQNIKEIGNDLAPELVAILANNAMLYAAVGWGMVQAQHDSDSLKQELGE